MATGQSKALAKLKKRGGKHWKKARTSEAKAKGQQLPGGITHGKARLIKATLDVTKKGENAGSPFVCFSGIVTEPEEYAGTRASIFNFFSESETKSEEERFEEFTSNLQLLGVENVDKLEMDDIPKVLKKLVKDKIAFLFNTWKPDKSAKNPNPSTMIFLQGVADDDDSSDDEDDDEDEDDDDEEESSSKKKKKSSDKKKSKSKSDDDDDDDDDDDSDDDSDDDDDDDEDEDDDSDDDDDDEDEKPAKKKSKSKSKTKSKKSKKSKDDDDDEDEDEDEDENDEDEDSGEPEKREVVNYKTSPKGKANPHEVTKVNKSKKTVTLKNVANDKVIQNVPWSKLQSEDE